MVLCDALESVHSVWGGLLTTLIFIHPKLIGNSTSSKLLYRKTQNSRNLSQSIRIIRRKMLTGQKEFSNKGGQFELQFEKYQSQQEPLSWKFCISIVFSKT